MSDRDGLQYAFEFKQQLHRGEGATELERLRTRVEALTGLVYDLIAEVEALRCHAAGGVDAAAYRRAYERTALTAHNSAGAYNGRDRLLWALFGEEPPPAMAFSGSQDGVRREVAMLRRLGATEAELAEHLARVEEHSMRT